MATQSNMRAAMVDNKAVLNDEEAAAEMPVETDAAAEDKNKAVQVGMKAPKENVRAWGKVLAGRMKATTQ